jgi:hypothetical protein
MSGYYPPTNQIKFTTSTSLLITSYSLISIANFLLVSQHIFSTESRVKEGTEIGLFTAALALTAINCMVLLYIKSRKMPKQGISLGVMMGKSVNFGTVIFTILQILVLALLIALFILSYTTLTTMTKVFIIMSLSILNIGIISLAWSFDSTYCGQFNPMQIGNQNQLYGSQYGQQYGQQYGMTPNW